MDFKLVEDTYQQLSEAYGRPESKYLPRILEMCLTDVEAQVLLSLPGTPEEVSGKLDIEMSEVAKVLKELFNKGFVLYRHEDNKLRYGLIKSLFESIPLDKRDFEKFGEAFLNLWKSYIDEDLLPNTKARESAGFRVIPIEKIIPMKWGEILPYERISEILENAEPIAVTACVCRVTSRRCDNPDDVCITLNKFADILIERGVARKISKEEASSILAHTENLGLVHQLNNSEPEGYLFLCNCCSCCCYFLRGMVILGKKGITSPGHLYAKSRFVSSVNSEMCDGCSALARAVCLTRCKFGAISIVDSKAVADPEKCFGCGLCASKCPPHAIQLIPVRSPEHIIDHFVPTSTAEASF